MMGNASGLLISAMDKRNAMMEATRLLTDVHKSALWIFSDATVVNAYLMDTYVMDQLKIAVTLCNPVTGNPITPPPCPIKTWIEWRWTYLIYRLALHYPPYICRTSRRKISEKQ